MILLNEIKSTANQIFIQVQQIRQHLHTHPELSFQEWKTAAYIQQKLSEFGIDYTPNVANTGTVALIKGTLNEDNKKVVALRADIDALPILEKNDTPYKSVNEGVMHACGHDAHTACLLGAAYILQKTRHLWSGTVKLIFQPGEEKNPGGASYMIADGVLQNPEPQCIIAQHVTPPLPTGTVGFCAGIAMASCDEINITITGKGGHGANPHLNTDPIVTAAHLIIALQQVVSRNANPITPCVLSIGSVQSQGGTYNVIPDTVQLKGTFRTFDEAWRATALQKIEQIAKHTAAAFGAECSLFIEKGYPYLFNNEALTQKCKQYAAQYVGQEHVIDLPPRLTSEDFSFYTQQIAGCFYRLGTGNIQKNIVSNVHTPTFDIDEPSLEIGSGLMAWLAVQELGEA